MPFRYIANQLTRLRYPFVCLLMLLLGGCQLIDDFMEDHGKPGEKASNVLYVQSNNPASGQNAILAYRRDPGNGTLTQFGTYLTGGTGHINPTAGKLGPNDLDDPIVATPDRKRMFAVNSGSNTIAVLNINPDGSLTPVPGSPFASGGRNPVSVGLAGDRLYVVNKNEDAAQLPNSDLPNYTGFHIAADGKLTPIPGATVTTLSQASPSHALVSRDKRLLFGADFLAPFFHPGAGSLRSFRINDDGTLTQAPGSPKALPGDPMTALPLGIWTHPSQNILYVGFVARAQMGVYDFNPATGALTFVTAVPNSGKEICWIRTAANGSRIYTVNNLDNSVSFYDASNPHVPVEKQKITLKEPGPMFLNDRGAMSFMQVTSTPFQPGISPDERFIYVVNQRVDFNSPDQEGNKLHILRIGTDGMLSEPGEPVDLPVPAQARPQGVVVF
jgi:6-phosphogluconolactonase (cycloisomerase 2 family)